MTFTICVRDMQTAKSCFEQVVPGDVHCCVVMVCLCCLLHCMPSKFQVLYCDVLCSVQPCISFLPQILLVTMRNAEERERTTFCLAAGPVWVLQVSLFPLFLLEFVLFDFRGSRKLCSRQCCAYMHACIHISTYLEYTYTVRISRRVSHIHCLADSLDPARRLHRQPER